MSFAFFWEMSWKSALIIGAALSLAALLRSRSPADRAAILRLGAVEEGTLRRHMVTDAGRVRDTVSFSIVADEWPAVRAGLDARLARA